MNTRERSPTGTSLIRVLAGRLFGAQFRLAFLVSRIFRQGFPRLWVGDEADPVIRLRRLAITARIGTPGTMRRFALSACMAIGWPVGSGYEALRVLRRSGQIAGTGYLARLRWFAFAWRLAMLHNVPPTSTASFGLAMPGRRGMGPRFLFWTDSAGFAAINAANGAIVAHVQDKAHFARLCEGHGLPCVETLAAFRGGCQIFPTVRFFPSQPAIHVKKLAGSQGQGASRWVRYGDIYRCDSGLERSPEGLMALCQQGGFIVQPLLTNHSALAPLSLGRLADVRIVTGIRPDGVAVVVGHATMRLPTRASATDRSPLWALVDSQTGRILSARQRGRPVTHHPDNGLAIRGHQLPHWPDAIALVTRAHRTAFPRFVSLGWDVALTPDGPVLIEANAGWGAEIMQTLSGEPLGDTALAEILSHYV